GGTGKSFLTGNIGILLARHRFKTLLIDADLGAANLHTILGLPHPDISLSDFINKRFSTLEEVVLKTPIPNLFLVSGARNKLDIANLAHEQKTKMLRAISKLNYHYILLDLSAGTSFNTIDFFTLSDSGIFVCCPEPTSIENFYRLIRSVYIRKIRQILKAHQFRKLAEKAEARNPDSAINRPEYLLDTLREIDPEKGRMIERILHAFQFKLILNQVRKQDNPRIGILLCRIIEKHLGLKIQFIGNVGFDERVHDELCKKGPFIDKYPYSQTTMDLKALIKGIKEATQVQSEVPPSTRPDAIDTLSG
ncbi:MAG TPA: AAA family ATPase, partial [Thermodesulfobacteriota bacterium]|nr:AAA family ATPase [Thermodesulfobacteriota bacterium]